MMACSIPYRPALALAAVVALAAGCGYGSDPSPADIAALSPQVTPISATLDAASGKTTYTVTVTNSPGDPTFAWVPPTCGTTTNSRSTGGTPAATMVWTHAGCAGVDAMMVTVDVTSQQYTTSCQYRGVSSGTGAPCGSEYTPGRY
jgi:hypothetical protein